jgi:uncharacterized protein YdeI (YjbR/CyaY-like superfamily)
MTMGTRDPRVDAYIAKKAPFAQPILKELRAIIHEAHPDIEEDIKWGAPAFMHKGIVCIIAGFKEYVGVNFWKGALIVPSKTRRASDDTGMKQLERLRSIEELPPRKKIMAYVQAAVTLNEGGVPTPNRGKDAPAKKRGPLRTPPSLAKALARNAKAKTTYEGFSPSHKREYVEWISDAKTAETRDRRIEQALGWLAEGKPRNWKYMKKR